jgi:predicted  nucleic acid-binding Zn-ribbon protein
MPGLQTVYQLQVADLEQADATRMLNEAKKALGETAELREAREKVQRDGADLTRLRTRVRDLELELESLTSRIASTEQRLYSGDVGNPKELANLQKDLVYLRGRRDSLEDTILEGLTGIDEGEARLQQAREQLDTIQSAWEADQARLGKTIGDLQAQLLHLDERIAGLRAALPAALLEAYDDTRRRKGGRGIAAIRGGLCEGCRVAVPTRLLQQVRRSDEITRCGSCGRILCVVE